MDQVQLAGAAHIVTPLHRELSNALTPAPGAYMNSEICLSKTTKVAKYRSQ